MLRPTPWRMLLDFHLIDFAVMSAEHDVSAKPLSRKVPTKRHAVSYKLSRWDASDSHLISLTLLHVHSSRRALAHSINLHFPSLPPYYNIQVFLFISILSFLINLSAFLLYNLRPRHRPSKYQQLARVLFFRRPILSTYEGTTPWLTVDTCLAYSHPAFLSLQSFPVILFLLTETRNLWFRIVFGISGFFFCKVIAYLANSKSWFGNNLPFPCNMQKSILPIRLALLPCTHFEKQKKLPDPKSERT